MIAVDPDPVTLAAIVRNERAVLLRMVEREFSGRQCILEKLAIAEALDYADCDRERRRILRNYLTWYRADGGLQ